MRKYLSTMAVFLFLLPTVVALAEDRPEVVRQVKVGMLLPLSGSYAAIGVDTRQGIEIALTELGNNRISPVYGDSRTEPTQAINEFRKMVDTDKVQAVFAFRGPVGMAVNPLSKQRSVPLLGGVGNKHFAPQNDYAFQMWPPSDQEGRFIANRTISLGGSRFALITAQDDWTHAVSEGFKTELSRRSKPLVFEEEVSPGEHDFRSIISKLKASEPNFVFVNVGLDQIGPLIRQLRELDVKASIISNFWINKPEVIQLAGAETLEGVLFAEVSSELPALQRELRKRFDSSPSGATLSAYVATMLLGQAAESLSPNANTDDLYSKMLEVKTVDTRNGSFPVEDRIVQFPLGLRKFHKGRATHYLNKEHTPETASGDANS